MENRINPIPAEAGHYQWQAPGLPPVSLHYNEGLHSLRVQAGDERRVFLLESSGFPGHKVALFNEYGLRCGSCSFDDTRQLRGTLRWEDQKFRFHVHNGALVLRSADGEREVAWPESLTPEASAGILLMMARQLAEPVAATTSRSDPSGHSRR